MNLLKYERIMTARENFYLFLSRIYAGEIDVNLLDKLQLISFPEISNDLGDGYRKLENYLKTPKRDPTSELATDFSKIFSCNPIRNRENVCPVEYNYTNSPNLKSRDAGSNALKGFYEKNSVNRVAAGLPMEHIAVELEYMAYMCQKSLIAINHMQVHEVIKFLNEQTVFLEKRLLHWVPNMCDEMLICSRTDFYKGIALITKGYLHLDLEILEFLISQFNLCTIA